MRLYSVKETCEMTGLTPKHLFDFKKVVEPAATKYDAQYKYYDENGINRLRQVAIYKTLGMKPKEIEAKMNSVNYNSDLVISEQIEALRNEKQKIEDLILVTEQIQLFGSEYINVLSYLSTDIHEVAKIIRNKLNEKTNKDFLNNLKSFSQEDEEEWKRIILSFKEVKNSDENKKAFLEAVDKLESFAFNLGANRYIIQQCLIVFLRDTELSAEINDIAGEDLATYLVTSVIDYYCEEIKKKIGPFVEKIFELDFSMANDVMLQNHIKIIHYILKEYLGSFDIYEFVVLGKLIRHDCLDCSEGRENIVAEALLIYAKNILAQSNG